MKRIEKTAKQRALLLFILDSYELGVMDDECALWTGSAEEERAYVDAATNAVLAHFTHGTPIPADVLSFLRFAVDMYIASRKVELWTNSPEEERAQAETVLVSVGGVDTKQSIRFDTSFKVQVDASYIIEDIQMLSKAGSETDWTQVHTTIECMTKLLDSALKRGGGCCQVTPSASSLVVPGDTSGILCFEDGSDIPCAAWKPVSQAMAGGCLQCPEGCPHRVNIPGLDPCEPEYGKFKLFNGFIYDGKNGRDFLQLVEGYGDAPQVAVTDEAAAPAQPVVGTFAPLAPTDVPEDHPPTNRPADQRAPDISFDDSDF